AGRPRVRHGLARRTRPGPPRHPLRARRRLRRRGLPRRRAGRAGHHRAPRPAARGRRGREARFVKAAITAQELFDQLRERLDLRWLAGQRGGSRQLEAGDTVSRRPSLAGYLNTIYPNKVQILGTEELAWLDGLEPRQR